MTRKTAAEATTLFETETKPAPKAATAKSPKRRTDLAVASPSTAPAPYEPVNFLDVIRRAAADPACDVAKMQALLDMQKQIVAEEARMAYLHDFMAMQAELPEIDANGKIQIKPKEGARSQKVQNTPYATYPDIHKTCMPILRKHSFVMWAETDASLGSGILVRVLLGHRMGHVKHANFPLPLETSGSKNNVQAMGSSISYGKRYGAIALLNIVSRAPQDKDLDGNKAEDVVEVDGEPQRLTDEQVKTLRAAMEFADVSEQKLCEVYSHLAKIEITKVEDLPPALYGRAIKSCAAKKG